MQARELNYDHDHITAKASMNIWRFFAIVIEAVVLLDPVHRFSVT